MDIAREDVILFDLGGVLMDFGGLARLAALTGERDDEQLRKRWVTSEWLAAYECGDCGVDDFSAGVVAEWDLDLTPAEFVVEFRSWSAGPFEGAVDLVRGLAGKIQMGCLSNTNPTHWQQHLDRWGIVDYFDWRFVSHELKAMKPAPTVYDAVIDTIGLPPERLLFLDDVLDNVLAARAHGMRAEHTRGIHEVRVAISLHYPSLA